ncbi:MAG TPA: SAM-dependent methyltransferase [Pseudonocardiaceae bacterium]
MPGPEQVDYQRPSSARMYDYLLGGGQNFAVDRDAAEAAAAAFPHFRAAVRANRSYLGRAAAYLAKNGIDQFLDLGSGIPTAGNVHEVVHRYNPNARVAYVDREPVAVAHASGLLADEPLVTITQADIRSPQDVLSAPTVADLLDLDRPIAVLAMGILHFLSDDDDPFGMLAAYRDASCSGSYLAISHANQVTLTDEQVQGFLDAYARTPTPTLFRTVEEIRRLLDGYKLIEPGLVLAPFWHPDQPGPVDEGEAAATNLRAAVGIKR